MAHLGLTFEEIGYTFYIATVMYEGPNVPASLPTLVIVFSLSYRRAYSHSSGCKVVLHLVSIQIFLITNGFEHPFKFD